MFRFALILLSTFLTCTTTYAQDAFAHYRSIALIGSVPIHMGNNHLSKDLNIGGGYGLNIRMPIHNFGISLQWQTNHHKISDDALFHINSNEMRNRLYTLFMGYHMHSAHGTFEPRVNISRMSSRYFSDYKNIQLLGGLGLKYGINLGGDGLFLTASIDYVMNVSNQIVAPASFSRYMNQSQTILLNVGLEWRATNH